MTILARFQSRNPEYDIDIREEHTVLYGYDAADRRTETGQRWQCFLVIDGHRVAILYSAAELARTNADSTSGRGIYEGLLVHANRHLTQFGIQLR